MPDALLVQGHEQRGRRGGGGKPFRIRAVWLNGLQHLADLRLVHAHRLGDALLRPSLRVKVEDAGGVDGAARA